jgi:hypothetical protein
MGGNFASPSPRHAASSSPQGVAPLLTGPMVGKHRLKCLELRVGCLPAHLGNSFLCWRHLTMREGGGEDPFICAGGREMGSISLLNAQHVLEALVAAATVASSFVKESRPAPMKVRTKGCMPPSARYVHVEHCESFFHNLSLLVPELKICRSLRRKSTLGALNFCQSVTRPEPLMPSSLGKSM